ncbi:MAG TPA: 50S ribosomal protein L25, partial [Bacteroidetes bacterium]|nr:50S ribosomal protein L25 [Bacteroidota bacterium]
GVKDFGGILEHQLREIEISCLPKDIPAHIEVNVSELNLGDSISVRDLKPENIEILTDSEQTIASVVHPRKAEVVEEEVIVEEEVQPEVIHGKEEPKENESTK